MVRHENDDPDVADSEMTTAGIYCFDTSIFDSWSQLGSTTVRIFVQVVAAIATFLGLVMVIMLWKTTRKPHGKCYHRTMGFFSEYIYPFERSTTYKKSHLLMLIIFHPLSPRQSPSASPACGLL